MNKIVDVSTLVDIELDYAVAVAEGHTPVFDDISELWVMPDGIDHFMLKDFTPSISPYQAYVIIVHERIDVVTNPTTGGWEALINNNIDDAEPLVFVIGSTPLEAAMRCYVASKLGYMVAIPNNL